MMMQFDPVWGYAMFQQNEETGETVLATAEGHDEATVGGEVGEDGHGHAASRTVSSRSFVAARPAARSR